MGWLPVVQQLVSFTFDFAEGWQDRQKQRAEQQHAVRMEAMKQQPNDFKDEVVLFLVAYPLVSAFLPFWGIAENTGQAINRLSGYPQWMTGLFVTICLAVYGVQKVVKAKK
jgi:hypothetical protein